MTENTEVLDPQKTLEAVPPTIEKVELSKTELDDLKHRAEVSSQNFERLKKAEKDLEDARLQLETNQVPNDPSGEDLGKLKSELSEIKASLAKNEVIEAHPILKEVWSDLEEFRSKPENTGMNLKTAAKAFMIEKELLEPTRKGLEKTTGGPRVPITGGMKADDVSTLRKNDYRKYVDMVKKGLIKVE